MGDAFAIIQLSFLHPKGHFFWRKRFTSGCLLLLWVVTGALLPQAQICPSKVTPFENCIENRWEKHHFCVTLPVT